MTHIPSYSPGLIVMYHYVRPVLSLIPGGIRPLLVSEFQRQLDWLMERYDIVTAKEFLTLLAAGGNSGRAFVGPRGKPPCLLTFDDGTRDHAEVVTPILSERGLSGLFFILSWPSQQKKMPMTHAVHWLLGGDDDLIWESFRRHAHDHLGGSAALGDSAAALRIYHYETPTRALIKYAANMAFPAAAMECIVNAAILTAGRTVPDLAAEWFASTDDLRQMHASGMTMAMHGCSHQSLQTLGVAGIRGEIHDSSAYLHDLTGTRPTWFACPFGGAGASANAVASMQSAMNDVGVVGAVSTEKRYVHATADSLALPRLDAIDLPPRRIEPLPT